MITMDTKIPFLFLSLLGLRPIEPLNTRWVMSLRCQRLRPTQSSLGCRRGPVRWSYSTTETMVPSGEFMGISIWLVVWNILFFRILGIVIPTDSYFSEGLKPPTSNYKPSDREFWVNMPVAGWNTSTSHCVVSGIGREVDGIGDLG